jgi:hypothetical protein
MTARTSQHSITGAERTRGAYGRAPLAHVLEPGSGRRMLLGVAGSSFVLTVALALLGGPLATILGGAAEARRAARGAALVAQSIDAVAAFPYSSVRTLDGAVWNDAPTVEASEHRVELRVDSRSDGWLQVNGQVIECKSARVVKTFTTYRGKG